MPLLFDRFTMGEKLGEGDFGVAYRGFDIHAQCPVVVKEYFPRPIAKRAPKSQEMVPRNKESRSLFEHGKHIVAQEVQKAQGLVNVSGIAHVRGAGQAFGTVYVVMEYVDGETLKSMVVKSPERKLSWRALWPIARNIMCTLEEIHEQGLIHGSLHPNQVIMRSADQHPIILDIVTAGQSLNKIGFLGSINSVYKAPEQFIPKMIPLAQMDEYTLCATMLFCLTGKSPEGSLHVLSGEVKHFSPRAWGSDIPEAAERVLMKGLSSRPDRRYPTIRALRMAFEDAEVSG